MIKQECIGIPDMILLLMIFCFKKIKIKAEIVLSPGGAYFVHSPHSIKPKTTSGIKGTEHPYVYAPHTQHPNNPSLSRFEVFPTAQTFCGKPDPLYSTQY